LNINPLNEQRTVDCYAFAEKLRFWKMSVTLTSQPMTKMSFVSSEPATPVKSPVY